MIYAAMKLTESSGKSIWYQFLKVTVAITFLGGSSHM